MDNKPLQLKRLVLQTSKSFCFNILTLSRPLDVNYVLEQGQGHGHLSKYLISGLIFHFFHVYMKKKALNPSLKKGLLIYLSSIKTELAINFLKKTFVLG